jgi:DNA-binding NarL/FixJ family response regulator
MSLTPRQAEIAGLVAKGLSTKQISAKTGLSRRTVDSYINDAAQRLGGQTPPRHRLTLWFMEFKKPRAKGAA